MDRENEIGRLFLSKDITKPRKMTNILTDDRRSHCKQKFQSGCYTPWEYGCSKSDHWKYSRCTRGSEIL